MKRQYFYQLMGLAGDAITYDSALSVSRIKRLSKTHKRQCENSCNGEGYIRNKWYQCDNPTAYVSPDVTVFDQEIERIERAIIRHVETVPGLAVTFQHDPRGCTVKLSYNGRDITEMLY